MDKKKKLIIECDQIVRALALERDGYKCVVQGTPFDVPGSSHNNLQVSHIYPKGKYPMMRFDLENVEIRCAGCHMYRKGSPHGDPAGFKFWLDSLPKKRMDYLHRLANHTGKVDMAWLEQTHEDLLKRYFQVFGSKWGE